MVHNTLPQVHLIVTLLERLLYFLRHLMRLYPSLSLNIKYLKVILCIWTVKFSKCLLKSNQTKQQASITTEIQTKCSSTLVTLSANSEDFSGLYKHHNNAVCCQKMLYQMQDEGCGKQQASNVVIKLQTDFVFRASSNKIVDTDRICIERINVESFFFTYISNALE